MQLNAKLNRFIIAFELTNILDYISVNVDRFTGRTERFTGRTERHECQTGGDPEIPGHVPGNQATDLPMILLPVQ